MSADLVERAWREFEASVVALEAGPVQRAEMKLAFFGGAARVFTMITTELSAGDEPQPDDLAKMDSLDRELKEFAAALAKRPSVAAVEGLPPRCGPVPAPKLVHFAVRAIERLLSYLVMRGPLVLIESEARRFVHLSERLGELIEAGKLEPGDLAGLERLRALVPAAAARLAAAEGAFVEPWVIWSCEHRAYWAPERRGYTPELFGAGRYSEEEATTIARSVSRDPAKQNVAYRLIDLLVSSEEIPREGSVAQFVVAELARTTDPHAKVVAAFRRLLNVAVPKDDEDVREAAVDIALDTIDNALIHDEGCAHWGTDHAGDRLDCSCGKDDALTTLAALARTAAEPTRSTPAVP
jgi:hypothetical protein